MTLLQGLALFEAIYVVAVTVWIVMEKRRPSATLAWILAVAALPIVGVFIYWVIGPRRIERSRSRRELARRRILATMPDPRALADPSFGLAQRRLDDRHRSLVALSLNNSQAPVARGNRVTVLRNGTETFPALREAIRGARHHVHLEYYIFTPDSVGQPFLDLLTQKAREGVAVRLLVDAVGSIDLRSSHVQELVRAGGRFAVFNPISFARLRPRVNFRNHRKIAIVDGTVGFCGGLNIADEYAARDPKYGAWRDTHLRIEGPAARALQLVFLEDWHFTTGERLPEAGLLQKADSSGGSLVQIVSSGPDREWPATAQLMLAGIAGAKNRVLVTTPYFVPDEAMMRALTTSALRGVDVALLLPRYSDSKVVQAAARSYYDDLLRAGVKIYEYLAGVLHAKVTVIDGTFAIVGTSNMDPRSFTLNFENDAVVFDDEIAATLESQFSLDLTLSREVTLDDRADLPFLQRLGEASARLLSPLL